MSTARGSDSISILSGCGKVTTDKLNSIGIVTLHDLLLYKGPTPIGINLSRFKQMASVMTGIPIDTNIDTTTTIETLPPVEEIPHTNLHSWFGLVAHYPTPTDIRRVTIDRLAITPYGVVFVVHWYSRGKCRSKSVSPLLLFSIYTLWTSRCVVSDDSEESSLIHKPVDLMVPLIISETEWNLTDEQKYALEFTVMETRKLQSHSELAILDNV